jgi:hypothetical protein
MLVKVNTWYCNTCESWHWDTCEDSGGFDRISPMGDFVTRLTAKNDAREMFKPAKIRAYFGYPNHYETGDCKPEESTDDR